MPYRDCTRLGNDPAWGGMQASKNFPTFWLCVISSSYSLLSNLKILEKPLCLMRESWHQCLPWSFPLWCKLQTSCILAWRNLPIYFGRWTFWETGRDTWSFKHSLQESPLAAVWSCLHSWMLGEKRTKGSYLGHFNPKLKPNCWRSHTFLWGSSSRHAWYTCLVRSASCKNRQC